MFRLQIGYQLFHLQHQPGYQLLHQVRLVKIGIVFAILTNNSYFFYHIIMLIIHFNLYVVFVISCLCSVVNKQYNAIQSVFNHF